MLYLRVCTLSLALCAAASAERVTYSKDVAPIFNQHCVQCHRAGEIAPMSLTSYTEARPWAKSIREKVANREMPPWFADPAHGTFKNDASLSKADIATIETWVKQGAPEGDPADLPPAPTFTEGWQLGEPDFIVELPEVKIPAGGGDRFPNLTFNAGDVPEGRWVRAVEIRPSNRDVAHHVVIFANGYGGAGMGGDFDVLGVWAVGTGPNVYPEGVGRRIRANQTFVANMHYHPNGTDATDTTRIGLYFGEGELKQELSATLAGGFDLFIPAGDSNHEEVDSWYVYDDIKVVSFFPHMHLRGKDMSFTAVYPDGREQVLLSVPKYSFDWQLFYYPEEPVALPKGSRIDIVAHYDNSADNPHNPDPTRPVYFGLESTDEMMFGIFEYYYDDAPKDAAQTDD